MAHPLSFKVYARPRGGRRFMVAQFREFKDALKFCYTKSTESEFADKALTVHYADGKVAYKFVQGVRQ